MGTEHDRLLDDVHARTGVHGHGVGQDLYKGSGRIEDIRQDRRLARSRTIVLQLGGDLHICRVGADVGLLEVHAGGSVVGQADVERVGGNQVDVPVQAAVPGQIA